MFCRFIVGTAHSAINVYFDSSYIIIKIFANNIAKYKPPISR